MRFAFTIDVIDAVGPADISALWECAEFASESLRSGENSLESARQVCRTDGV